MNKILAAALATALVSLSQVAQAAPVTLTGSIADGAWLGAGNHAGSFDGSALLPNNFKIHSAAFVFNFSDDQDGQSRSQQAGGSSAGGYAQQGNAYYDGWNWNSTYVRNKLNYENVWLTGQAEGVSISLDGVAVGSGATARTDGYSQNTVGNGRVYDFTNGQSGYWYSYSCGNRCSGSAWASGSYQYYYSDTSTQTNTYTTEWNGGFSVAGEITNLDLLNELISSSKLDWNFLVTGDLFLNNAKLVLDIEEIVPTADVPEPSTLLLMALGLFGLAGLTRRARQRS